MGVALAKQAFTRVADSSRYNIDAIRMPAREYDPTKDKADHMNPVMLKHFWQLLRNRLADLNVDIQVQDQTLGKDRVIDRANASDVAAAAITDRDARVQLKRLTTERTNIINIINDIEINGPDSDYGFCLSSGKPIPVERLLANITANRTVEAQEDFDRTRASHRSGLKQRID